MTIRVYIVEDHAVMRETLVDFLALSDDIEVCGTAESAEEAVLELAELSPSIVLLDLSLKGRSGLDLLHDIRRRWRLPCVILSGHGERAYVGSAFAAGAQGYVLKGRPREVPGALRRVMDGEVYLSDSLRETVDHPGYDGGFNGA